MKYMDDLYITGTDVDMYGVKKENIFIARDKDDKRLGLALIYPYYDYDIEPLHPHNLFLHLKTETDGVLSESIKDALLEKAVHRAIEIKHEQKQEKTRLYACFLKNQLDEISYFLQRGFIHDEGMHIFERCESTHLNIKKIPEDIDVRKWDIETEAEQHLFIETHQKIFPRHAYSVEKLAELKSIQGWRNFTAFSGDKIAGNIMVYSKPDANSLGIIEDLFVLKRWRRQGVGRYLLYISLAYLHSIGIHRVQLELWSANKKAIRLYQEFGFSSIEETEIAVGKYV